MDELAIELRQVRRELGILIKQRSAVGVPFSYQDELRYQGLCLRERQLILMIPEAV